MKLSTILSLIAVAAEASKHEHNNNEGSTRILPTYFDRIRVYCSKKSFDDGMERWSLERYKEDFSTFLGSQTSVDLAADDNEVGAFEIEITNAEILPDVGSIAIGGEFEEERLYNGVYEKDVTEIKFNNFEENRIYAFGAKWSINQDASEDDSGTHLRLDIDGLEQFNLVKLLYEGETDFLGFIVPDGYTYLELFAQDASSEIEFVMSEITISTGGSAQLSIFGSIFEIIWPLLGALFGGVVSFLEAFFDNAVMFVEYIADLDYGGIQDFLEQFGGESDSDDDGN